MATKIKPELSQRNSFYLEKYRYLELKNFVRQYGKWRYSMDTINYFPPGHFVEYLADRAQIDPVAACVEARNVWGEKIALVDRALSIAVSDRRELASMLLEAVTEGTSYDALEAQHGYMPVSRSEWYKLYRKFFWILDKLRD